MYVHTNIIFISLVIVIVVFIILVILIIIMLSDSGHIYSVRLS